MQRNNRRNRGLELGVLLLINEILNVGFDAIPPVTLSTIIGQALLYLGIIDVPWDKWDVCLSARKVWNKRMYRTLFLSQIEHADDMHLYYNMISFLIKGRTLEYKYGSANFALLLGILTSMTSALYVALSIGIAEYFGDQSAMNSCAIGFSGVIFALKLITTLENPAGHVYVMGFNVPTRFAAWAELIAIHVMVPNASFIGHLAGILAGLLYYATPLRAVVDSILTGITGRAISHGNYGFSSSSYHDGEGHWFPQSSHRYGSRYYSSYSPGYR